MTAKQQALRAYLKTLQDADGFIDPERVVEDARNPTSFAHDLFDWDDASAAHAHRLDVARQLIRSVRYVETVTRIELQAVPEWVHVTRPGKPQGYAPLDHVKSNAEMSQEVLNSELKQATAALKRALAIGEVLGVRTQIEDVIATLVQLQQDVSSKAA